MPIIPSCLRRKCETFYNVFLWPWPKIMQVPVRLSVWFSIALKLPAVFLVIWGISKRNSINRENSIWNLGLILQNMNFPVVAIATIWPNGSVKFRKQRKTAALYRCWYCWKANLFADNVRSRALKSTSSYTTLNSSCSRFTRISSRSTNSAAG